MTPYTAFPIADIALDDSPKVRIADDENLIEAYADAMRQGAEFPPVQLYRVNGKVLLADGKHRRRARLLLGHTTITAEVYEGTWADLLWASAGANRAHGQRLTPEEMSRSVAVLLDAWPMKTHLEIAQQVGCSESLVSKVKLRIARERGGPVLRGRKLRVFERRKAIRALVQEGLSATAIIQRLGVHSNLVAEIRRELGVKRLSEHTREVIAARRARIREMAAQGCSAIQMGAELHVHPDTVRRVVRQLGLVTRHGVVVPAGSEEKRGRKVSEASAQLIEQMLRDGASIRAIEKAAKTSKATITWIRDTLQIPRATGPRTVKDREHRLAQIQRMADEGYTTRQIAAAVGLGRERVREIAKRHAIDISADRVVGTTHRHDANRIVERTVMDAENLTAGTELIKYDELDGTQLARWIASLKQSREQLSAFIRRLMQEQSHEAAEPVSA